MYLLGKGQLFGVIYEKVSFIGGYLASGGSSLEYIKTLRPFDLWSGERFYLGMMRMF